MQYQSTPGRLFGREVLFTWNSVTKRITFERRFMATENVGLHCLNERPEEQLLQDTYAKPWIRSYAIAQAKMLMGQARGKFQSLAGPSGGITMNGAELKQEAQAEMEKLEEELKMFVDSSQGWGFIVG